MKKHLLLLSFLASSCSVFSQWTQVTYFNSTVSDIKAFNGQLFFVGGFTERQGSTCYWSAAYNGTSFTNHTQTIGGIGIRHVDVFNNVLYSADGMGSSTSGGVGVHAWDGDTWNGVGGFSASQSGIFADGNDLYIGGDFGTVNKMSVGSGSFTALPGVQSNSSVPAIAKYNGAIVIGGGFTTSASGTTLNHIAQWDGTAWQPLGTGLNGTVLSLAVYNNALYAAGTFSTAGGQPAKYIAKWNGTAWSDVGGSVTDAGGNGIKDLLVYNNKLYAVGDFDAIGGVSTKSVARWNGTAWTAMSLSSPGFYAQSIEAYNNMIYVGMADFDTAYVYRANPDAVILGVDDPAPAISTFRVYPRPAQNLVTVQSRSNVVAPGMLSVYDVCGRLIETRALNNSQAQFDVSGWAPGQYLVIERNAETGLVEERGYISKQ